MGNPEKVAALRTILCQLLTYSLNKQQQNNNTGNQVCNGKPQCLFPDTHVRHSELLLVQQIEVGSIKML